jgi:ribosomal protein S25
MGKIIVPGRLSGRQYAINIKGDTPSATEQARIRQFLDEREGAFAQEYEQRFGRPLAVDDGTALGRGWEMGKASATSRLGTATEYLGSGLGIDSLRGLGQSMRAAGDQEAFMESLRQPEQTQWEDVDSLGSFLTFAGEQAGQTGPESLASLGATLGGTLVGTAATGNPLTGGAIGIGTGAMVAAPTIFGGNIQRQEAEVAAGRREKVDVGSALAATVGQSVLESVSDKLLLSGLVKPGMKVFTRTVAGAAEGATTEGLTEVGQQMLERWQAGLPLDNDEAIKEYINAGIAGGVIGAPVRGGTAALGIGIEGEADTSKNKPKDTTAPPPAAAAPTAPTAAPPTAPTAAAPTAPTAPRPAPGDLTEEERAARDAWQAEMADEMAGARPRVRTEETPEETPVEEPTLRPKAATQAPTTPAKVKTPQEIMDEVSALDDEDFDLIERDTPVVRPAARAGTKATAATSTQPDTSGWKLHLNPVPGSEKDISDYLTEKGVPHKVGRNSDQSGKGMTIYVGAKDAATELATDLDARFGSVLNDAEGDALNDDVPLAGKVWGRFDIGQKDPEFHQYGKAGVPFLNDDMGQLGFAEDRAAAAEEARKRADAILKARYGNFYTGSAAAEAASLPPGISSSLLAQAKQQVEWSQRASVEHLQDYMEVSAQTAEDLLTALESQGVVSAPDMNGKRRVLEKAPTTPAAAKAAPEVAPKPVAQPAVEKVAQNELPLAPTPEAAPQPVVEEVPEVVDADLPTELEAFEQAAAMVRGPVREEPEAAPVIEEPVSVPAPKAANPQRPAAPKVKEEVVPQAKAMSEAEATQLFNEVATGQRQTVTPEEALGFPDNLLELEPKPELVNYPRNQSGKVLRDWIARNDARRKIGMAKSAAQTAVEGAARRKLPRPKTRTLGQVGSSDPTMTASGLLTPTDARTLQPSGPARLGPETFTLRRRNRRMTGKPTVGWLETLQEREANNPTPNAKAEGLVFATKIKDFFDQRAPESFRKFRSYIQGVGEIAAIKDVTTHTDKGAVYRLLYSRNNTLKNEEAEAAFQFFSRFPNVMEALQEIGAVSVFAAPGQSVETTSVAKNSTTPHEDMIDIKDGKARAKIIGAEQFYAGIKPKDAIKARAWVVANLSPKAQIVMGQAANSTKTEVEAGVKANAVVSAAHDAVVAEVPLHESMAASALEVMTKENEAMRKTLARKAEDALREVKVAAPTKLPFEAKPIPNLSGIKYRKGETRSDAILRHLRETGRINKDSNDTQILDAIDDFEAGERAVRELIYGPTLKLLSHAVDAMAVPLRPSVVAALRAGNLRDALIGIGLTHPNPLIGRIMMKMSEAVGTTKVRIVDDLRAEDGTAVPGLFDPSTNEILLDSKTGLNRWATLRCRTRWLTRRTPRRKLSKPSMTR